MVKKWRDAAAIIDTLSPVASDTSDTLADCALELEALLEGKDG